MESSRTGMTGRAPKRGWKVAMAACCLLGSVGCQVEYAGMTLPSGKYFYDDVQYFAPGPDFPLANTLAAQQRARMMAQGIDPMGGTPSVPAPPTPGVVAPAAPAAPAGGGAAVPPPPAPGMVGGQPGGNGNAAPAIPGPGF